MNKFSVPSTSKDNENWNKWGRNTNNLMINLSDLVEENTASSPQLRSNYHHVFEPSEITGRSTSCSQFKQNAISSSPSVEQILAQSFSEDVRNLGSKLEDMKFRQSLSHASLPRTADISMASTSFSSDARYTDWGNYKNSTGIEEARCLDEEFVPHERVKFIKYVLIDSPRHTERFGVSQNLFLSRTILCFSPLVNDTQNSIIPI